MPNNSEKVMPIKLESDTTLVTLGIILRDSLGAFWGKSFGSALYAMRTLS
jgi:hypothetical protein